MKKQSQSIFTVALLALAAFVFIYIMLNLVQGVYAILSFLAPVLLIGALFVNHKVVLQFGNFLINRLTKSPLTGIAYIAGTFFLFPLVAALLLVAAFGSKKLQGIFNMPAMETTESHKTEETEFEILDDDADVVIIDDESEILLLPEKEKQKSPNRPSSSKYEDLF